MVLKVWSGQCHHQRHTTHLKHLQLLQSYMLQESKLAAHKSQSASNRRLGFILLSVVVVFFLGILIKRGLLG
ncbi:cytochrome oxidase small assembly protein [Polynucleobacter asymbioticus]|uniref:cytochrome oxidase small assembly protein n=1 Tax=Polynucleobacter asymbioticus TaxID=576611 RepID=UPI003EB85EC9